MLDFISEHLRRELDFEQEANNAMTTAKLIAEEPRLRDKVYVPQVYEKFTTKKVMTAEWIDGVGMTDRSGIKHLMGERVDTLADSSAANRFPTLEGGIPTVLKTMVELFSAQIFEWGWVHCDPHPGNMIVRPHPTIKGAPQLVLLDHGLYVRSTPEFRQQYATLWKSLMTLDLEVLRNVASEWGIGEPKLFASATLMRPISFNNKKDEEAEKFEKEFSAMNEYERSVAMKQRLQNFLVNQDRIPKELVFIGRNLRLEILLSLRVLLTSAQDRARKQPDVWLSCEQDQDHSELGFPVSCRGAEHVVVATVVGVLQPLHLQVCSLHNRPGLLVCESEAVADR